MCFVVTNGPERNTRLSTTDFRVLSELPTLNGRAQYYATFKYRIDLRYVFKNVH